MRITFLGTGTSHGIPVIGCACDVCRSRDPRDRRTRTGCLVETGGKRILIDASPELRLQLVAAGVTDADALLLTHAHTDHVGGLDDVRIFSEKHGRAFPVYSSAPALRELRRRFSYVFRNTQEGGGKPRLELHPASKPFRLGTVEVVPIPAWHGRLRVLGYRIGGFAYLTDVSAIPAASYPLMRALRVLTLGALRYQPHETHFHVERALAEAEKIGADKTYFTHMCHLLGHRQTEKRLPSRVRLAYDGLVVRLP